MSVTSLHETALMEIISRADAPSIARYKVAIAERENVLLNQSWYIAMDETVAQLRAIPNFAAYIALIDTIHLGPYGRRLLFVDKATTTTYCFWYGANNGPELRMSIGNDRHNNTLLEVNSRRITCTCDIRAYPSSVVGFAYALLTVNVEDMLEKNHKKAQQ
jgi:hypothetical protein